MTYLMWIYMNRTSISVEDGCTLYTEDVINWVEYSLTARQYIRVENLFFNWMDEDN